MSDAISGGGQDVWRRFATMALQSAGRRHHRDGALQRLYAVNEWRMNKRITNVSALACPDSPFPWRLGCQRMSANRRMHARLVLPQARQRGVARRQDESSFAPSVPLWFTPDCVQSCG